MAFDLFFNSRTYELHMSVTFSMYLRILEEFNMWSDDDDDDDVVCVYT